MSNFINKCVLFIFFIHVVVETQCYKNQDKYDDDRENGDLGFLVQRPICDNDGFYGPVVCIPGQTYICFI